VAASGGELKRLWEEVEVQVETESGDLKNEKVSTVNLSPLLLKLTRGSTFALRRSTLEFCLGGQRSLRANGMSASEPSGNNLKGFNDFHLKAKVLTVLYVPYSLNRER